MATGPGGESTQVSVSVNISNLIQENHCNGRYTPSYLGDPPESPYGNEAFSMTVKDILGDYAQELIDKPEKGFASKEICYVKL